MTLYVRTIISQFALQILTMIKETILNKLPTWYKEINPEKHYLVLTNDMDSYYSCDFLRKRFKDIKVGGFYDFKKGLFLNKERTEGKQPIYVDLSISEGMTFDNHYSFIKNPMAINPNVNTTIYNRKYNGSTLAVILSLFDKDFSQVNETYLTALLYIDGWYIGYYNKGGAYKDINIYWYEALGLKEYLLPILEQHDANYFVEFGREYRLNEEIYIDGAGKLYCGNKIPLPKCTFELVQPVERRFCQKYEALAINNADSRKIFTSAETYYNKYTISLRR